MNQNIWGPSMWFSLHTITFSYPLRPTENDKSNYKIFFENFKNVIPCSVCKKNYIRHLKEHPIDNYLSCRKNIIYWLIDLHNLVNVETGKKILEYNVVIKKYEKIYNKKIIVEEDNNNKSSCDKPPNILTNKYMNIVIDENKVYLLFIIFLIIMIVNIYYSKYYKK
jgi:hypothetical protein